MEWLRGKDGQNLTYRFRSRKTHKYLKNLCEDVAKYRSENVQAEAGFQSELRCCRSDRSPARERRSVFGIYRAANISIARCDWFGVRYRGMEGRPDVSRSKFRWYSDITNVCRYHSLCKNRKKERDMSIAFLGVEGVFIIQKHKNGKGGTYLLRWVIRRMTLWGFECP